MQEDLYHGDEFNLYAYCRNNPVIYDDLSGYVGELTCKGISIKKEGIVGIDADCNTKWNSNSSQ